VIAGTAPTEGELRTAVVCWTGRRGSFQSCQTVLKAVFRGSTTDDDGSRIAVEGVAFPLDRRGKRIESGGPPSPSGADDRERGRLPALGGLWGAFTSLDLDATRTGANGALPIRPCWNCFRHRRNLSVGTGRLHRSHSDGVRHCDRGGYRCCIV